MKLNEDFTTRPKFFDIGRWHVTNFVRIVSENLSSGSLVLDAGAGECAYKKFFFHCNYKSVDLGIGEEKWNYKNLDYVAPLDDLPLQNDTFDAVLCTQVLEHVEHPRRCVQEFYRVLKQGGQLYLTVPMSQPEHQIPYDFFRYTSFGLKSILQQAGFEKIEINPFGGKFTRWAYEIPSAMSIFPKTGFRDGKLNIKGVAVFPVRLLLYLIIRILQFGLLHMDRFDHNRNDPFGWSVIAVKA